MGIGVVFLNEFINLYVSGGFDGMMFDVVFVMVVFVWVMEYNNFNSDLFDDVMNVEFIIYDLGFLF